MFLMCYVMERNSNYIAKIDTTLKVLLQRVFFVTELSPAEWMASSFTVQQ